MKIGVALAYISDDLAQFTLQNKLDYCTRHRYVPFIEKVCEWDRPISMGFHRIYYVQQLLLSNPDIDWLMWVDNDAIFMNFQRRIEEFTDNRYDVIIGEDWNGINSGVFLIRNSEDAITWCEAVLNHQIDAADAHLPEWWLASEQYAIYSLLNKYEGQALVKLVPYTLFNSRISLPCASDDWRWIGLGPYQSLFCDTFKPGDFIIHFAGSADGIKIANIRYYLSQYVVDQQKKNKKFSFRLRQPINMV